MSAPDKREILAGAVTRAAAARRLLLESAHELRAADLGAVGERFLEAAQGPTKILAAIELALGDTALAGRPS